MNAWLDAHAVIIVSVVVWAPATLLLWLLMWGGAKNAEDRQRRVEWKRGPGDETTHRYTERRSSNA